MSDNNQYLQMFFDESAAYIQTLNESILELENNPENDNTIDALFRAAHSLKGMAATMGFDTLTELTHKIENLMDKVRNQELEVTTELIDLLFAGIDHIEKIVNQIKETGSEEIELEDYLNQLEQYLKKGSKIQDNTDKTNSEDQLLAPDKPEDRSSLSLSSQEITNIKNNKQETDLVYSLTITLAKSTQFPQARASMVLKSSSNLGYIVKSDPEKDNIEEAELEDKIISIILVSHLGLEEIKEELSETNDVSEVNIKEIDLEAENDISIEKNMNEKNKDKEDNQDQTSDSSSSSNGSNGGGTNSFQVSSTVRVDIKKLDTLMNMIGELLINKTRLQSLDIENDDFTEVLPQLDRVTMELHHTVMQIRMEPVGVMFNRFPRMIRDLSKKEDKEVDFILEGEDTELDRSIIDELGDPMTHLLRNSIDHGIEKPELREEKGKDREGTLALRAYQKGSEILIEVEDDGGGIDTEKLTQKALNKGLTTEEEIATMDKTEKLNLIFHPGLSTTEEVSDVSGRGVGMDVVKSTVEKLDGEIYIESEPDAGTKITLSLPLTLAITEALMVKIDEEIFAIPLNNIKETLMIKSKDIKQVKGKEVISLRDQTIPLLDSRKKLNIDTDYGLYRNQEEFPAVLIQSSTEQFGLIVDELRQQQEIVIKSLGEYMGNIENISGATIIGDGEVALILDVRNIA